MARCSVGQFVVRWANIGLPHSGSKFNTTFLLYTFRFYEIYSWRRSILRRTLVSADELSLSCARPLVGTVTTLWLRRPLSVSQHGQLSLPSLRGRLMSSNPCYSGLRRQTAEGVVRGVAYRPRQRVLLAARLECRLAAGSRPRNGDERRSLALYGSEKVY